MPDLGPFVRLHYAPGLEPSLVTSPPYDVISPAERDLLASHPKNFVHVILPFPDHDPGRYASAAHIFRGWLGNGTLVSDEAEQFYLYRTDYSTRRGDRTTLGIVGALLLEPFGEGSVLPHEHTTPAPKADRLELTRQVRANLEPLWFVAASPLPSLPALAGQTQPEAPMADFKDASGVRHRLWAVAPARAGGVASEVAATSLVVADGHHRYEMSVAYRDELRKSRGHGPWDRTLALVTEPEDNPPALLSIHRVVRGLSPSDLADLAEVASLTPFDGKLQDLLAAVESAGPGLVGVAAGDGMFTLRTDPDSDSLDSMFLERRIFQLLRSKGAGKPEVAYQHDPGLLEEAVATGAVAFVLAPVDLNLVIEFAMRGDRMPPKTTLFWPKPRSGLVMRDLGA